MVREDQYLSVGTKIAKMQGEGVSHKKGLIGAFTFFFRVSHLCSGEFTSASGLLQASQDCIMTSVSRKSVVVCGDNVAFIVLHQEEPSSTINIAAYGQLPDTELHRYTA